MILHPLPLFHKWNPYTQKRRTLLDAPFCIKHKLFNAKLFLSEVSLDVSLLKNILSLEDVSTGLL